MESEANKTGGAWRPLAAKAAVFAAVVVALQAILFGPSLLGCKILLPLDILAMPYHYLPTTPGAAPVIPHNVVLSDLVFYNEPCRRFGVSELRQGRLPLWNPYGYAGSPFTAPKHSPLWILQCCVESPTIIAWTQVIIALIASSGMFFFCRRVLRIGFWPAAIAAWCYPITGFFVFWQTYSLPMVVVWLPWLLWATDRAVRRPIGWGGPTMALFTCLAVVSGKLDIAGQTLLVSGLYAVWCIIDQYGKRPLRLREIGLAVAVVAGGWAIGLVMAAPEILPTLEYAQTGSRALRRGQGEEERPPIGLVALPQVVLPFMYSLNESSSLAFVPKGENNLLESASVAYTGLLAALVLAPLAFCSRRYRSVVAFWIILGFVGLSWCLNVPGMVDLLRMPGLNMMSHNRFVFATSLAILATAAIGLDVLWQGGIARRWWFWLPIALLAALLLWCIYRSFVLPEPIASQIEARLRSGEQVAGIANLDHLAAAREGVLHASSASAVLCGLGLICWLVIVFRIDWQRRLARVFGGLLLADLLWFAYGQCTQCDPALYFPPIPALEAVAKAEPGRIIGFNCLPANFSALQQLRDIRGYDGVDPARLMDLLVPAADPRSQIYIYALSQWLLPKLTILPSGEIQLPPVFDMLNVRYVIFRGTPPPGVRAAFSSLDYWVLVNDAALPRVFVPRSVEFDPDAISRLAKIGAADFDPRQRAYVESPVKLPGACSGKAEIVEEIPTRIVVSLDMDTPGLVVLSDLWDKGWKAYLDGKPAAILRTNHAVRGVAVPAGKATLEFRYELAALAWGRILLALATLVLLGWVAFVRWRGVSDAPSAGETAETPEKSRVERKR